eukprot:5484835-Pleurochrysis_carterae.AAC.1
MSRREGRRPQGQTTTHSTDKETLRRTLTHEVRKGQKRAKWGHNRRQKCPSSRRARAWRIESREEEMNDSLKHVNARQ